MVGFRPPMVRAGDRLGERYQVIEPLASGGMGALWRARHLELGVDVAIKVVTKQSTDPLALKRFKREAQAAAKLRSPHIVQVLDFGEHEGQPYLTMELLRGEDLCARLQRSGRFAPERCADIIDGIAKAVQLAHAAGIVHRDLKPANIFLERVGDDEVVKVLDFGVAKELDGRPESGGTTGAGVIGSPSYMSPEQAWGHMVGPASDVWAMGVVAFEMLTGANPFADESLAKVFEHILRDPLPVPSQRNGALPASVDRFFQRAFARTPGERIGSAKEFAEGLRAALRESELPAQTARAAYAITRREDGDAAATREAPADVAHPRRWRAKLWVVAALALVVAVGLVARATRRVQRHSQSTADDTRAPEQVGAVAPSASTPSAAAPLASADADVVPAPAPPARPAESVAAPAAAARPRPKRTATPDAAPPVVAPIAPQHDPKFGIPLGP
jgi:eukaryotic-like serine/threonine-protein kinase